MKKGNGEAEEGAKKGIFLEERHIKSSKYYLWEQSNREKTEGT